MRRLAGALLLLAACGGGDDGAAPAIDGGLDAPPGTAREVIGTVDVFEQRNVYVDPGGPPMESLWASVRGSFYDGRAPSWHREVARAGDCVLKRYTPSLCDPACTNGLCVEPDVCEPWPSLVAAGRLEIDGLKVGLRMPGTDGFYYPESPLPNDLFADDAQVQAALAGGGSYPMVTVAARGVPPLTGAIPDGKLTLVPGHDAVIRWTPAAGDARVRLTLNSNNQGHGQPYLGIIECDVADAAGEVTVAAALVDGFPETQAWRICAGTDCPPSTLRRYHRGTFALDDREVELLVASEISFGVDHVLPD